MRETPTQLAADASLPRVVYTPASMVRTPGRLLRGMLRDLLASRELAWRLFVRNTSARFRQTFLGYFWALAPPAVATTLFVFLRRGGLFVTASTAVPYVVFLLTGMVLWQTFVDAVNAPLRMVTQSKAMLTKINFPREALILAGIAEVLFNFLIRLVLLIAVLGWYRILPPPTALLAPVGLLVLIGVGVAVGVALVPIAVLYQDVEQALTVVVSLWMFVTPVLYPPPANFPGTLTMTMNPVGPVLDTARAWILTGHAVHLAGFAWVSLGAAVVLFAGWVLYRLALPILIERMSA